MKITSVSNTRAIAHIGEVSRKFSPARRLDHVLIGERGNRICNVSLSALIAANVEQSLPQTPFVSGSKRYGSALCSLLPPPDRELVKLRSAV